MYKIQVQSEIENLHIIFKAKLDQYDFKQTGPKTYVSENTVDDLMGVLFYKSNLGGRGSPLTVTAKRTERIA